MTIKKELHMGLSPDLKVKMEDMEPETRAVYKRFVEMSRFYQRAATRQEVTRVMSMTMDPDLAGAHYGILEAQGFTELDFSSPPVQGSMPTNARGTGQASTAEDSPELTYEPLDNPKDDGIDLPAVLVQDVDAASHVIDRFEPDSDPQVERPMALITGVERAYAALRDARSDLERLAIRDQARAAVAAAAILKRRDIQVEASVLVATAEREIAKANPPAPVGRPPAVAEKLDIPDVQLSSRNLKEIRQTHSPLTDEQFSEIAAKAREHGEPLTRATLKREARKLNEPESSPSVEPRPPTRTKKLEAQVDALSLEVQEKARHIGDLEEEVRFLRGELSDLPHEREAMFSRQQAVINALRAELATEQGHHNDLKAAHRGAIRRIRELESLR